MSECTDCKCGGDMHDDHHHPLEDAPPGMWWGDMLVQVGQWYWCDNDDCAYAHIPKQDRLP
jgi:hypothetical protein